MLRYKQHGRECMCTLRAVQCTDATRSIFQWQHLFEFCKQTNIKINDVDFLRFLLGQFCVCLPPNSMRSTYTLMSLPKVVEINILDIYFSEWIFDFCRFLYLSFSLSSLHHLFFIISVSLSAHTYTPFFLWIAIKFILMLRKKQTKLWLISTVNCLFGCKKQQMRGESDEDSKPENVNAVDAVCVCVCVCVISFPVSRKE